MIIDFDVMLEWEWSGNDYERVKWYNDAYIVVSVNI